MVIADILVKGLPAFVQYRLMLDIDVAQSEVDPSGSKSRRRSEAAIFRRSSANKLRGLFPDVKARADRRKLDGLLSSGAADFLRERVVADPASDRADRQGSDPAVR